jgi:GTP-binding protein
MKIFGPVLFSKIHVASVPMFVDELTITAAAGKGGDGVVRWRQEKFMPMGGPAGGNGGRGGDVYMRAVRDLALLAKYTGAKEFKAKDGESGQKRSRHGEGGADIYIDVPVGAIVTEQERGRIYTFMSEGETHRILKGGRGGLGNEHFKSSTNRSPEEATKGRPGEYGTFHIELSLIVDAGIIGLPNAGKSTLLNALTRAAAKIGSYPFTTVEPHLGDLHGCILADIPGLIEGASEGKGLGHKFLRHITRTKMLIHCVSLEDEDPVATYQLVRAELQKFDSSLLKKEEWIVLTKRDTVPDKRVEEVQAAFREVGHEAAFTVAAPIGEGVKELGDALTLHLRKTEDSGSPDGSE